MKTRQEDEIRVFPMFFAFNDEQFAEGMEQLGLAADDYGSVTPLGSSGCFCRRSDAPALYEMFDRHEKELADAIAGDKTGDGFIYDMFMYELSNHEYSYTGELDDTLDALGLTEDEVYASQALRRGLAKVCKSQLEQAEKKWGRL
jgi:hypothetical protein